jgi:predicted acylesterase/phospholipase RssA
MNLGSMISSARRKLMVASCAVLTLTGCANTLAFHSVPAGFADRALVGGFLKIRAWGDSSPSDLIAGLDLAGGTAGAPLSGNSSALALSGGGGDGAFGAGLLVGWSATGARPRFSIVTGVSTGALMAPFAFLGSAYDGPLSELYTRYRTSDLGTSRLFSALAGGPSLADSDGLEALIAKYVDGGMMAEIAQEHRAGRRLLIATTNVEAQRQVIWSLGAIAASGRKDALSLLRNVIRASAALPGVFPPVLVTVKVDGKSYQEMHGDGGTTGQVFFVPMASPASTPTDERSKPTLYVVRNATLKPQWQQTPPTVLDITSRALATLISSQGKGDIDHLQSRAKAARVNFRLAAIPADFTRQPAEPFDQDYMRALFALGFDLARQGYRWTAYPP